MTKYDTFNVKLPNSQLNEMTKYNTLNVKLSNSQLNKLKWGTKNGTEANLNLSLNVVGDSNDGTNFS